MSATAGPARARPPFTQQTLSSQETAAPQRQPMSMYKSICLHRGERIAKQTDYARPTGRGARGPEGFAPSSLEGPPRGETRCSRRPGNNCPIPFPSIGPVSRHGWTTSLVGSQARPHRELPTGRLQTAGIPSHSLEAGSLRPGVGRAPPRLSGWGWGWGPRSPSSFLLRLHHPSLPLWSQGPPCEPVSLLFSGHRSLG